MDETTSADLELNDPITNIKAALITSYTKLFNPINTKRYSSLEEALCDIILESWRGE